MQIESHRRTSDVELINGPIFFFAQSSRPETGYKGKRPASRKGGPAVLTQASFASHLSEQGRLNLSRTYFAASFRRKWRSWGNVSLVSIVTSHHHGSTSVSV